MKRELLTAILLMAVLLAGCAEQAATIFALGKSITRKEIVVEDKNYPDIKIEKTQKILFKKLDEYNQEK